MHLFNYYSTTCFTNKTPLFAQLHVFAIKGLPQHDNNWCKQQWKVRSSIKTYRKVKIQKIPSVNGINSLSHFTKQLLFTAFQIFWNQFFFLFLLYYERSWIEVKTGQPHIVSRNQKTVVISGRMGRAWESGNLWISTWQEKLSTFISFSWLICVHAFILLSKQRFPHNEPSETGVI